MAGHDAVVHFAAESHVDRSIAGPDDFINTNCFGTNVMCDVARQRRGRPGRAHRHRRGVRLGRGRLVDRDRPARAPLAVLGVEGRLRPDRALVPHTYGLPVIVTRCTEQLRAVPVPREGHPAVHHQPARRAARSRSTATASTSATGCYVDDHCAGVDLVLRTGTRRRDLQHRRRQRDAEPGARRQAARRCSARGEEMVELRRPTGSATIAATPSTSPRSPRSAGRRQRDARRGARRRPSPGTATTAGGGSRSRRA